MMNDNFLIPIAVSLFIILIVILFRYVKPLRNQADFIIGLLNKLSEEDDGK